MMEMKISNSLLGFLGTILFLMVAFPPPLQAQAQESLQVRFVSIERIREGYSAYQATLAELDSIKQKEQQELDSQTADFDKSVRQYELKDGLWPTEVEKEAEFESLRRKFTIMNEFKGEKDGELQEIAHTKLDPMIENIKETIKNVSSTNGFHLVFKQKDLAYYDNRLDITDMVLETLNRG